jgi:hypothetical protein
MKTWLLIMALAVLMAACGAYEYYGCPRLYENLPLDCEECH